MSSVIPLASPPSYAKNPISYLQELCVKHQLPIPLYNELESTGPPHSRTFRISVNVGDEYSEGTGFTKKQAKASAASSMYEKLSSNGLVNTIETKNKPVGFVCSLPTVAPVKPRTVLTDQTAATQPKNFISNQKPTSVTELPLLENEHFENSADIPRPNPFNPHISINVTPQNLIPSQVLHHIARVERLSQTPSPPSENDVKSLPSFKSPTSSSICPSDTIVESPATLLQEMQIKNPVSLLQELCAKHKFKLPIYVDKDVDGPSHNRIFTIQVTAAGYTADGTASTKKEAKRKAAEKALMSLEQTIQTIVSSQRVS